MSQTYSRALKDQFLVAFQLFQATQRSPKNDQGADLRYHCKIYVGVYSHQCESNPVFGTKADSVIICMLSSI